MTSDFDRKLASAMENTKVSLCDAAIRQNDATVWQRSSGQYLIYSISKIFIATLVLQQVQAETIQLSDDVGAFFNRYPSLKSVTVEEVLQHRGGLPDYGASEAYSLALRQHPLKPWTAEQFLEYLDLEPPFERGTFHYSNIGYLLLRLMLEEVTGKSFHDLVQTEIAERCKLTDTFVATRFEQLSQLVPGTTNLCSPDGKQLDVRFNYHPGWVSHGVLVSTVDDTTKFLSDLLTGSIIPENFVQAMCIGHKAAQTYRLFEEPSYGCGVMIGRNATHGLMVGHSGDGPGYGVAAYDLPNYKGKPTSIAIFCPSHPSSTAEKILLQLLD